MLRDSVDLAADRRWPPSRVVWHRRVSLRRRLRLAARLGQMGPAEIVHRVRKIASKWLARRRGLNAAPLDEAASRSLLPPVLADAAQPYLLSRTAARGFFDVVDRDRLAAAATPNAPESRERTLHEAESILHEGVVLLGKRFRPFDPDFDWRADPDEGPIWPLIPLDDADAVRGHDVDVKFVWEVNRHQFLVTLARAYAYSGDERYAAACVDMVRTWIRQNPVGHGVNWASNLELAIRSLSWVWALHFLLGSRALEGGADLTLWLASLRQHRDALARNLTIYVDPTNHLIGELCALAVLSMWLPELDDSAELADHALVILAGELSRQVASDGVDREQALSYQRFVLELVLQVVLLADRNSLPLPEPIQSRAAGMLEALRVLVDDNHRAPHIGDSDDAHGWPFFLQSGWDFGGLIATAESILGPPAAGPERARAVNWVAGGSVARPAKSRPRTGNEMLPTGYAVLREPADPSHRLVFDCGPLGLLPHASHGHADLLSVLVNVAGLPVLVDRGTFAYTADGGMRNRLRATRAHNTVEVGGHDQAEAFDPFKWLNIPRTGSRSVGLSSEVTCVEGWHDGYARLRPGVVHRRAVVGVRGGWLLIDWLEGRGQQHLARWFHASPQARVERMPQGAVRLRVSHESALIVQDLVDPGRPATPIDVGATPHSERYGQLVDAPTLRLAEQTQLPAVRLTLLAVCGSDGWTPTLQGRVERRPEGDLEVRLREPGGVEVVVQVESRRRSGRPGLSILGAGSDPRRSPPPGHGAGRADS